MNDVAKRVIDGISVDEIYYHFIKTVEEFSSCMNDYLYVYDVQNDLYYITSRALKRFHIEKNIFADVFGGFKKFVHPADYDFLVKELMDVVTGAKSEHNLRYRWLGVNGETIWISCRGKMVFDTDGNSVYLIGCVNEVGQKQQADNVSGLLGEMALREQMRQYVSFPTCQFLRIGIDGFKEINEIHGTEYGDWILYEMGQMIDKSLEVGQDVYRVGSDEFIIFDRLNSSKNEAKKLYKKIRNQVAEFIKERGYEMSFTISCGLVSSGDLETADYHEIDKYSQFALSTAKNNGRNQLATFNKEAYVKFLEDQELIKTLRQSILHNFEGFELYFQPIVDAQTEEIYAAEALLRYHTQDGRLIVPTMFIEQMEESGLIVPVGRWILNDAYRVCKRITEYRPNFKVSVNLSYIQVIKSNVVKDVAEALDANELDSKNAIVELTESGFLQNDMVVRKTWNRLHNNGVTLAIDDFGTGYSNFSDLGDLHPELLKIDRTLTMRAISDTYIRQLIRSIIDMANRIGIRTVMEGIETREELVNILELNPSSIQGYYYGKPCSESDFMEQYIL